MTDPSEGTPARTPITGIRPPRYPAAVSRAATSTRRLAWASYGAAAGLAVGTVAALATGAEVLAAAGAAVGVVAAVAINRMRERRR